MKNNSEVIFAKRHDSYNGLITGGNGWAVDFFQCPRPQGWNRGNLDGPYLELVEEFEYIDGTPGKLNRTEVESGLWTMDKLWGKRILVSSQRYIHRKLHGKVAMWIITMDYFYLMEQL